MNRPMLAAALLAAALLTGCGGGQTQTPPEPAPQTAVETGAERVRTGSMELKYAEQFAVDYYSDGTALLTVADADRFLVVPEGAAVPAVTDATVLKLPLAPVYVAASSAMDLFGQLGALDAVGMTSTTVGNWGLPEVREAMEAGTLVYAGKYSAPDFELLLSKNCGLAVESTMIYHSPEIKEQLEALGVPVLVERSSYEPDPLGRVEWIKLYGLLLGKTAEAERFFDAQTALVDSLDTRPAGGRTAAFFHISSAGAAVVRKPGDYVSKMLEMAGGRYIFDALPGEEDASLSTMNMQMESFYAGAKDADVLIYNSTIDGELQSLDQLLEKSSLLADFKAVQAGNVWCTEHDMFQKSSAAAGMIADFNTVLSDGVNAPDELTFLHRLR